MKNTETFMTRNNRLDNILPFCLTSWSEGQKNENYQLSLGSHKAEANCRNRKLL